MFQLVSLSCCHAHPRKVQLLCYSPFRWLKSIKPPSFRRELYHPFSKTMFSGPLIILVLFAEHFPISLVLRSPVLDTTLLIFLAMAQQRMNHLPQLAGNTSPIRMLASFACKHTLLACSQPAVDWNSQVHFCKADLLSIQPSIHTLLHHRCRPLQLSLPGFLRLHSVHFPNLLKSIFSWLLLQVCSQPWICWEFTQFNCYFINKYVVMISISIP